MRTQTLRPTVPDLEASDMPLRMQFPDWDPPAERLIALVRLALAAGSLLVIWIDPTQPAKYWPVAYAAFGVYVLYSAAILYLARTGPHAWLPLTSQIVDLLWILPVVFFTEAANTPFFVFFVTFTLAAGLRWGFWASWAVTAYSLLVYGALLFIETPTPLDLNNDLMRLGYLLITGVLGGYLTEYRRRRERELRLLRGAAAVITTKHSAAAAMAAIVDVARNGRLADLVVGVLRDPADGFLMCRGAGETTRIGEEVAAPFLTASASGTRSEKRGPAVLLARADQVLLRFAGAERGLAYPIRAGDDVIGAVLFFFTAASERRLDDEFLDLLLGHLMPHIETLYILEQAPHTRVMEERRRIARDLHDSFIQVLGALGLRLDVLAVSSAITGPAVAQLRAELIQLREIVADEQKRVRAYLKEMREPLSAIAGLPDAIEQAAESIRIRTKLDVEVTLGPGLAALPRDVVRELAPLVREALTNVEKHARATRVAITARADAGRLTMTVSDDGIGIGADRAPSRAAGAVEGHGLASMRERARLLHGTLEIRTGDTGGTTVIVSVPVPMPPLDGESAASTG